MIQSSFNHVLQHGHTIDDTFDLVSHVRPSVTCGLLAMVSYSIVHRVGLVRFMARAATAGFDDVILLDVPVEEADSLARTSVVLGPMPTSAWACWDYESRSTLPAYTLPAGYGRL